MGFHLGVVNQTEVFNGLHYEPIIVNDWDLDSMEGREALNKLITTEYSGDTIESIPTCGCETPLTGKPNKGRICPNCNQPVEDIFGESIDARVWVRPPQGVQKFMNPIVWLVLQEHFTRTKTSFIEWFANHNYRPDPSQEVHIERLKAAGFKRGWNYFVENYKEIIDFLHYNGYGKSKQNKTETNIRREEVYKFLTENYEATFTDYLPVPNRIALVKENSPSQAYADPSQKNCIDAIRTICSVENSVVPMSQKVIENRVFKFQEQIGIYYSDTFKDVIGRKEGMSRHHVYGSRLEFTARGVITSISDWHDYDECHMPWSMALSLFRVHITSKLLRRGFTPRRIGELLSYGANHYDPLLDEILKELISESPYTTQGSGQKKGIPIVLQRNPTLHRLSAQLLYVTKIKADRVEDNTIGMSVKILKGPNADFDGDALNMLLITDDVMYRHFYNMSSHLGILDLHKPRAVSGIIDMPAPIASTICAWLDEHED